MSMQILLYANSGDYMSDCNPKLSLETLKSLTPFRDGSDVVTESARELFLSCVKSEACVRDVFFYHTAKDPRCTLVEKRLFPFATFATAFVAQTLISIKDGYKFHAMLSKDSVAQTMNARYDSVDWKKIGFHLYTLIYPKLVRDSTTGVCLKDFIDNQGHVWAERLIEDMQQPKWTKRTLLKFVRGKYTDKQYNRDMNDLLLKLHLLDPQSVLPAYQHLFHLKALPVVNLELATRNYLGDRISCDVISSDVKRMMNKPSNPLNSSMLSLDNIELFYGLEVEDFIITECRNLGLWTGNRPDNKRVSTFGDRCVVS